MTTAEFFKRTVIVLCIALVPVLIWFLFDVILIAVGAILIGVLLHLVAEPLIRWCKLPLLAIVIILFVFGGVSVIFAGPLAVIAFVAIKKLYVRDSLGEATALPGEPERRGQRMAG